MKWITAADIKNWVSTNSRHCQETLPELMRRLILGTAASVERIEFPCGDSVTTGGWDGTLETTSSSPFFPQGVSGWEIGVEASAKTKADGDYQKRTDIPLGLVKSESTFVFVTPRVWPRRSQWEKDKKDKKDWKSIRVIAADDLELWLASAPAVALWLARQLGKVISGGIRDLEAIWEEWSEGTEPKMLPDLVIGGRSEDAEAIRQWIGNKASILEVQGDNPDEAFAFLYAAISTLPGKERDRALARCVVAENISEFRQLIQAYKNYPLIIAASGECVEAAPLAMRKGHHVFISLDAKAISIRKVLRLSRPQRQVVEKSLIDGGVSETEAQRIARDSGRSIPVLRRQLFQSNAVSAPVWANAESARTLIPLLFAGAWDENKEGDREVIEMLSGSGVSHKSFEDMLSPLLFADDSPIRKIGSVWMLKSPLDAWFLLSRHLTEDSLRLLENAVLAVLTKTDPKYGLEPAQRWAAAIYGKSNPYSGWLRTGIVESLVLAAVYGDRSPYVDSTQAFADHVVRQVFATADKWEAWASINDVTPLLAEAAPKSFMEVVQRNLKKNSALFQELMSDDGGPLFGECRHSGLLWALESLAWSSEYFSRAANILFELAQIDKGGRWANRAKGSLSDIFLPGFPQTHATPEERLTVLDSLITKDPRLVWEFAQRYCHQVTFSESHRFRWRESGGDRRGSEPENHQSHVEYMKGLVPKLSDLACARENLISSLDKFTHSPEDVREKLLNTLEAADVKSFAKDEQAKIFDQVRRSLNWINSYGDDERRKHVPALYRMWERFTPADVLERVGWLVGNPWPRLPEGEPKERSKKENILNKIRDKAAREVLDKASLESIMEFAGKTQYVQFFGSALAKAVRNEEEDIKLLDTFVKQISANPLLIQGYALGRVATSGQGWVEEQIKRMKTAGNYSPEVCALLYLGLPEGSDTWSIISSLGQEVESAYWKKASGYSGGGEDAPIAVEKLLDAGRPLDTLQIAGEQNVSIPSVLLQRLLQDIADMKDKKLRGGGIDEYHLGLVFNQLYERQELSIEEMAALEWPFAAFFDVMKPYITSPMAFHRILQKNPLFFAQLVSFIYKRDDDAPDDEKIDEEKGRNRLRGAREVFRSWSLLPGMKDDGTLDEKELTDWIDAARKRCAETSHVIGGDLQIASILAHAPADPDGIWPHIAVRNAIEHLDNDVIDEHISVALYNARGVISHGLMDGGKPEWESVEKYKKMSDALKTKWPRTGAMLRSLAHSYESMAKYEDIESDLRDLRWN